MQSAQHKKLYENALSTSQSPQALEKALSSVLRLAIGDHSHFHFLLYNIHWFSDPYVQHLSILEKSLRLYRGRGKESQKVAYNILTDGMWSCTGYEKACNCLINLIKNGYDQKLLKQSLRQNYPHKLTDLQMQQTYLKSLLYVYQKVEKLRFDILEMVLLELASLDTELSTQTSKPTSFFATETETKASQQVHLSPQQTKLDTLLSIFLQQLVKYKKDTNLYKQLLLIFKNDLVLIEQTNYVQFIIYYFAESSKQYAKEFVVFLVAEVFEKIDGRKCNRKVIVNLACYLASYLSRSVTLNPSFISKSVAGLIKMLNSNVQKKIKQHPKCGSFQEQATTEKEQNEINLGQIFQQHFDILLLLQTVLWIWVARPQCRDQNYEQVIKLLQNSQQLTQYKYFICSQLLYMSQFHYSQTLKNQRRIETTHKFEPPILKRLNFHIDPLLKPYQNRKTASIKIEQIKSEVKLQNITQGVPQKRTKSEKRQSERTTI